MSVVARQGFKYSIVGYLGFVLGALSTYFVFPFDFEFYGKLRYVLSTSEILVPIVVFGLSYANVKFFHQSQKVGKHQNILSLSLVGILVNFVVFLGLFFLFHFLFPEFKENEWWSLKKIILPLVLVLSLSHVFNRYISNYKRIVVPNIFENLFPKIANLGAFCLFFFLGASESSAFGFFIGMFLLSLIGYGIYTNRLEKINPDFSLNYIEKDGLWKQILNYSFFGFLGNIGNYVAIKIDSVMVGDYLGMEELGVYGVLISIISLISVPQLGVFNMSAPIINQLIEEDNLAELDRFHKKISLSLFFLGAVLLSCILVGFPYLANFIKNGTMLRESEPVIWIIGSAVLFDLATGFNGNIISLSKYYRFNIVVMIFLAFLTIVLNLYFLKNTNLGIVGIALATAISLTIYNVTKIVFNYIKFKVQPLTIEMIYTSIICFLAITVAIVLPDFNSNLLNLVYKPAVVLLLIFIGNFFLKIYPIEQFLNKKFIKNLFRF